MSFIDTHVEHFMQQALRLAEQAVFIAPPNPAVGCVIVKDHRVIGEGFTQAPGGAHAEIQALNDAKRRGHDVRGATVIVTLEPCCHVGRTGPCVDALIAAGVGRVIAAMLDPNPKVSGCGIARLQAAGIATEVGLMKEAASAAESLNIGFFTRMRSGKPWVRMKIAASLDGKTALINGQSQWITGPAAREDGHRWRARSGAILTGIGTVMADDPQLTVRTPESCMRQPLRVILDSAFRIPPQARILHGDPCLIVGATPDPTRLTPLTALGAEVLVLPDAACPDKVDLSAMLLELGRREINEVHVEAGATLSGALLQAGYADELLIYLAPRLLGEGRGMFALPELTTLTNLTESPPWTSWVFRDVQRVGEDVRVLLGR